MIEDGAYFKGSIEIDKSAEKESSSNAFTAALRQQQVQRRRRRSKFTPFQAIS